MWPPQQFQKHVCVIFITVASLYYYLTMKKKTRIENDDFTYYNVSFASGVNRSVDNYLDIATLLASRDNNTKKATTVIHILGLFELSSKLGPRLEGGKEMKAALKAVNEINDYNVIPGYKLNLLINDTKCDPGVGIDRFFHAIYSNKTITMLLGSSCSNVTESLAHVVPYWNILQVSFGSTSPALSDRNKFPLFFRTIAPVSSYNSAKIHFVKHFKWNVVAAFSQTENEYLLPLNNLVKQMENSDIFWATTITFSLDNYKEQLKSLKDMDIRVIFGSFSPAIAPRIFCEVYNLSMYGGDYLWIMQDYDTEWWRFNSSCDHYYLGLAIEGLILFSANYSNTILTEKNPSQTRNLSYESSVSEAEKFQDFSRETYDAMWAMALTLRQSAMSFWRKPISSFNYESKDLACSFVDIMSELKFIGALGPLRFHGSDRVGDAVVFQIQGGSLIEVAVYDSMEDKLHFDCDLCSRVSWQGKEVPIAKRILKIQLIKIPLIVFYLITFVSILGVISSLLFFYFNLRFRRMKSVKLSSPKLNNVAVLGCILVYLAVIASGYDRIPEGFKKYFTMICTVRVYLLAAGFSLAFGAMFAKTYRVHRLFTLCGASAIGDKTLKDNQLIGFICIPLVIDILIILLWVMIDPLEHKIHNLSLTVSAHHRGIVYQQQIEVCRSHNTAGWFIALYGYKGLLLIMGVFMAWENRHVKIPVLNDSQHIGICVYSAVFASIVIVLSSLLSNFYIFSYLAFLLSLLFSTTVTLGLLFLPKLKAVFGKISCDDSIMESMGLKLDGNTKRLIINYDRKEMIHRLEVQNRVYLRELEALEKEIEHLEDLLAQGPSSSTEVSFKHPTIYNISSSCDHLTVTPSSTLARASWPWAHQKISNEFLSESRLNNEKFFSKINIFIKLKRLFGSLPEKEKNNSLGSILENWAKSSPNLNRIKHHSSGPSLIIGSSTVALEDAVLDTNKN